MNITITYRYAWPLYHLFLNKYVKNFLFTYINILKIHILLLIRFVLFIYLIFWFRAYTNTYYINITRCSTSGK